jgi:predicted deacylase
MEENKQAPPYGYNELGKMGFKSIVYNYSQILDKYKSNKALPSSIQVKPWYLITNILKISIVVRNTGGNVRNNYYLNKYLPTTQLSLKVIQAAKQGTPMVTIGKGNGPKVMILAGVHGNELPGQIAAMKLINNLSNTTFKGTIYIIPFAMPYATSYTSRYWQGKDPNRTANKAGSPTYQIIKLAKKLKITALVDYHSTQPGGFPGQDSALCTLSPRYESYTLASYISKSTTSKLISYKQAGVDFPGAVEDVCNLEGITSVTSEVKISHGFASNQKITKSYNQMISFLRYYHII